MRIIAFADGGSRGNPGIAGAGAVLYPGETTVGPQSTPLRAIAYAVGKKSTNNVAEYHGLLCALSAAKELGATEVAVYLDSKLVVEQMSGRWKVKHPDMQVLAAQAREVVAGFDSVSFEWVPRSRNKVADELSNIAMDAVAAGAEPGIISGHRLDTAASAAASEVAASEPAKPTATESSEPTATALPSEPGSAAAEWLGQRGEVTAVVALRHGQTEMSAKQQYAGHQNPQLTDIGQAQARAAAAVIARRWGPASSSPVSAVISSPLERCQQTAAAVAAELGLSVIVDDELIELDFGRWDGKTFAEAQQDNPELHDDWLENPATPCPGGESLEQLHQRVTTARRRLEQDYRGKRIVVVSHVNPIKSLISQALGGGADISNRVFLDLASLTEVEFWDGGGLVRSVNDIGHLYPPRPQG